MQAFVVPDAHGNWGAVRGLLVRSRAVLVDPKTHEIRKRRNVVLVQLGDLMNCVKDSSGNDYNIIRHASIFDVLLVGNHEHPYWPGYITKFAGFHYDAVLANEISKRTYHAAYQFGGVLVTHAGLSREYEEEYTSAKEAATLINARWRVDPVHAMFNDVGKARGGRKKFGGVLWSDYQEAKSRNFTQLFGHTPGGKIRERISTTKGTKQVCLDLGAKSPGSKIAGAWISEDGQITPVIHDPMIHG